MVYTLFGAQYEKHGEDRRIDLSEDQCRGSLQLSVTAGKHGARLPVLPGRLRGLWISALGALCDAVVAAEGHLEMNFRVSSVT